MRITIVGVGYVGLVTGACFAELGNDVICVDSAARVRSLIDGVIPIYEPGLQEIVQRNFAAHRLMFADQLGPHVRGADVVFLAVATPRQLGDGEADLSQIFSAAREIASHAADGLVVVTKSTVPVETGTLVERLIRSMRPDLRCAVVSNPEFLKEGTAITDFMSPDRVVVGADEDWAALRIAELYFPLSQKGVPMIVTGRNAAEVIKYAATAFLAAKI